MERYHIYEKSTIEKIQSHRKSQKRVNHYKALPPAELKLWLRYLEFEESESNLEVKYKDPTQTQTKQNKNKNKNKNKN